MLRKTLNSGADQLTYKNRQADRWQTHRQIDKLTNRKTDRKEDRQTKKQEIRVRQKDRERVKQKESTKKLDLGIREMK